MYSLPPAACCLAWRRDGRCMVGKKCGKRQQTPRRRIDRVYRVNRWVSIWICRDSICHSFRASNLEKYRRTQLAGPVQGRAQKIVLCLKTPTQVRPPQWPVYVHSQSIIHSRKNLAQFSELRAISLGTTLYTKREGREHVESSAVLSCLRGKWPFILDHDISSFKMSSSASVYTKVYKVLRVYNLKFI